MAVSKSQLRTSARLRLLPPTLAPHHHQPSTFTPTKPVLTSVLDRLIFGPDLQRPACFFSPICLCRNKIPRRTAPPSPIPPPSFEASGAVRTCHDVHPSQFSLLDTQTKGNPRRPRKTPDPNSQDKTPWQEQVPLPRTIPDAPLQRLRQGGEAWGMGHDQSHRNPRRCPTVLASPSPRLPSTFPAMMGWMARV